MQNIELKVEGSKLTITVDLSKTVGPSKTGKTLIVATTAGNVPITDDGATRLGLNVYRYAEPKG